MESTEKEAFEEGDLTADHQPPTMRDLCYKHQKGKKKEEEEEELLVTNFTHTQLVFSSKYCLSRDVADYAAAASGACLL